MLPFRGINRVTQPYNYVASTKKGHGGIDIVGDDDRTVLCVASGKVVMANRWDGHTKTGTQSYGNLIVVQDNAGNRHYYAHLDSFSLSVGNYVYSGDKIGVMGNTGNSYGSHLHYEVRTGKTTSTRTNPANYIDLSNKRGTYTSDDKKIDIWLQAYNKGKWSPWVKNGEDYAGNRWHSISGLKVSVSGESVWYQVHTKKHGWLSWVKDYNDYDSNGYAGVLGTPIDAVKIVLDNDPEHSVEYSVSSIGRGFYPTVTDYNDYDSNGYAGTFGKNIDRITAKIVRK